MNIFMQYYGVQSYKKEIKPLVLKNRKMNRVRVSNVFDKNGTGETAPPESILARAQLYKGWLTRSKGKIDIQ